MLSKSSSVNNTVDGRKPASQLINSLSKCLPGFIHPRSQVGRVSINSIIENLVKPAGGRYLVGLCHVDSSCGGWSRCHRSAWATSNLFLNIRMEKRSGWKSAPQQIEVGAHSSTFAGYKPSYIPICTVSSWSKRKGSVTQSEAKIDAKDGFFIRCSRMFDCFWTWNIVFSLKRTVLFSNRRESWCFCLVIMLPTQEDMEGMLDDFV